MDTKIKVRDFLSNTMAVSTDKAENIFIKSKEIIENEGCIVYDFEDVKLIITAFLNISIGKLYGLDIDFDIIDRRLSFVNTTPSVERMIKQVIDNSKKFYINREEGLKNNNYLNKSIDGDI